MEPSPNVTTFGNFKNNILKNNDGYEVEWPAIYVPSSRYMGMLEPYRGSIGLITCQNKPADMPEYGIFFKEIDEEAI